MFVKLLPGKHTHADCTSTFTALVHNFNQQPGHSYIYIHVYLALSGFFAGGGTSQNFEVIIICNIRESVDSLCRDGTNTPIVRVHTKPF